MIDLNARVFSYFPDNVPHSIIAGKVEPIAQNENLPKSFINAVVTISVVVVLAVCGMMKLVGRRWWCLYLTHIHTTLLNTV